MEQVGRQPVPPWTRSERRTWKRSPRKGTVALAIGMIAVIVVVAVALALALVEAVFLDAKVVSIKGSCAPGTSCHLISWGFFSLVPIAAAVCWVLYRLVRVRSDYQRYARDNAAALLDTELLSPRIVGRDDLCDVLQRDLETRWEGSRRPIVLVGGVGSGKTAVLARLTQLLAERSAVPVPVRLRAAQRDDALDLLELARTKFMDTAPVISEAEADKIWRRLRQNDQLVIVADGLEEALADVTDTRETAIRAAFERVRRDDVAVIVSSRPHAALKHLDAAMVELEPLQLRDAIEYITGARADATETSNGDNRAQDLARVRRIARAAELTEMPLVMHIAQELYGVDGLRVDSRGVDRLGMRARLIGRWMTLLEQGRIRSAVPVKAKRRAEVVRELESIAAFGLMHDKLEVTFKDFTDPPKPLDGAALIAPDGAQAKESLEATTEKLREVAADAERLGLVDARPEGVLFRHSVMQAYLGSRRISEVLAGDRPESGDASKLWDQLEDTLKKPGRELLMALAMSCATEDVRARTRAIRLLLRNVAVEDAKERAVYTAAAVLAAAAASTDRPPDARGLSGGGVGISPYKQRSRFRSQVILWLTRAECEDAESQERGARKRVDETRAARDRAQMQVDEAELRLDDAERHARSVSEAMASGSALRLVDKRKTVAGAAVERAETEFLAARVAAARARALHAEAHAEAAIAETIRAEKKLAEAAIQPGSPQVASLRQAAEEGLARAEKDVDEASCERLGAANDEAQAYSDPRAPGPRVVRAQRRAEQLLAEAAVAEQLLAEAVDAHEDAKSDLVARAQRHLRTLREASDRWGLAGAAGKVPPLTDDESSEQARQVRSRAAELEQELRGETEAPDLRTELELALRAIVAARDADAALRGDDPERALEHLAWATGALERCEHEQWAQFARDLKPLALAAARSAHARHLLEAASREPDREAAELRAKVVEKLNAVSSEIERASVESARDGRARAARRATSRAKVLVPLSSEVEPTPADTPAGVQAAKLDAVARFFDAAQFVWLWDVCKSEPDAHVRMSAARKLGAGGFAAFEHVEKDLRGIVDAAKRKSGSPMEHELMGWLLPLLYTSIESDTDRGASDGEHRAMLRDWLKIGPGLSVRSGVALAEGMRFAANERELPAAQQAYLTARAEDLIGGTRFWFSKIILLQALTLWLIAHAGHDGPTREQMDERISKCCSEADHPLVKATIKLCVAALRDKEPANYIWLDERAATSRLGAGPDVVRGGGGGDTDQWIPSIAGWLALAPQAQQLLADVVVFMNLLDRGDDGPALEDFVERTFPGSEPDGRPRTGERSLPLCLAMRGGRAWLDVGRQLNEPMQPGTGCDRARCNMRLCPYPGLGEELSRGELSEAFCRRQVELVARRRSARPEWQREATPDELRAFWRAMERRPRA